VNAHVKRFLVIGCLFLSPIGCAVGGSTESATDEAETPISARSAEATPDGMSACYDDYNCRGSVLERGGSLRSCNNMDDASSWRSAGGKCFNL
jgi:hypothetical protein